MNVVCLKRMCKTHSFAIFVIWNVLQQFGHYAVSITLEKNNSFSCGFFWRKLKQCGQYCFGIYPLQNVIYAGNWKPVTNKNQKTTESFWSIT